MTGSFKARPILHRQQALSLLESLSDLDGIGKLALITAYEDGLRMVKFGGIAHGRPDFMDLIVGSMEGLPE